MAVSSVGAHPGFPDWPLLAAVPEADRKELIGRARRRTYARGEVLVRQGDPSDSLHLVEAGRLAVRVDTAAGDAAMLNVIGPSDWFGELSLLGSRARLRSATVVALEQATTRSLTEPVFAELRRRHPAIGELLLTLLSQRVEELSGRLVEAMYDGLDRRVQHRLLDLVRVYGHDEPERPVIVPLTQEQLAELVGGTRQSVNEVLQKLNRRGVVDLERGRIVVHRPDGLARRAS